MLEENLSPMCSCGNRTTVTIHNSNYYLHCNYCKRQQFNSYYSYLICSICFSYLHTYETNNFPYKAHDICSNIECNSYSILTLLSEVSVLMNSNLMCCLYKINSKSIEISVMSKFTKDEYFPKLESFFRNIILYRTNNARNSAI